MRVPEVRSGAPRRRECKRRGSQNDRALVATGMPGALVQVETCRKAGIAIRESVHDDGTRVAVRDAALRVQQAAEAMGDRERQVVVAAEVVQRCNRALGKAHGAGRNATGAGGRGRMLPTKSSTRVDGFAGLREAMSPTATATVATRSPAPSRRRRAGEPTRIGHWPDAVYRRSVIGFSDRSRWPARRGELHPCKGQDRRAARLRSGSTPGSRPQACSRRSLFGTCCSP